MGPADYADVLVGLVCGGVLGFFGIVLVRMCANLFP